MQSKAVLDRYRRASPKERIAQVRDLMDVAACAPKVLPAAERAR